MRMRMEKSRRAALYQNYFSAVILVQNYFCGAKMIPGRTNLGRERENLGNERRPRREPLLYAGRLDGPM